MVFWEIYAGGAVPYGGMTPAQVAMAVVVDGYRLARPSVFRVCFWFVWFFVLRTSLFASGFIFLLTHRTHTKLTFVKAGALETPDELWTLMQECWAPRATDRPTLKAIIGVLVNRTSSSIAICVCVCVSVFVIVTRFQFEDSCWSTHLNARFQSTSLLFL